MKKLKVGATLLAFTLLLTGCSADDSSSVSGETLSKVNIGIDTAAGGSLQIRSANANGYFENHGITPNISNFAYGIDTINALLTAQTDTGLAADYALLNSITRGDLVVLSTLTSGTEETIKLTEVLAAKGIDKPQNIKGKRLGVAKGTVAEYHWAKYLEHYGIDKEDIKYVPYSTPDEAIVGMKKGDIDVVLGSGALLEKFKAIDGVHQIDDLGSIGISVSSYLVATNKLVEENEGVVTELLKVINEGINFVSDNPDKTAKIAYDELKIPEEDALRDLQRTNYEIEFSQKEFDHLQSMKAWLLENGLLKEDYNLEDYLHLEPLSKAFPELETYGY